MTVPQLSRAHLEALALATVLQDPAVAETIDFARLSPAAVVLIAFAADENTAARASLGFAVENEFSARLAKRAISLTLEELLFFPRETLIGLVNALPAVGAELVRPAA